MYARINSTAVGTQIAFPYPRNRATRASPLSGSSPLSAPPNPTPPESLGASASKRDLAVPDEGADARSGWPVLRRRVPTTSRSRPRSRELRLPSATDRAVSGCSHPGPRHSRSFPGSLSSPGSMASRSTPSGLSPASLPRPIPFSLILSSSPALPAACRRSRRWHRRELRLAVQAVRYPPMRSRALRVLASGSRQGRQLHDLA